MSLKYLMIRSKGIYGPAWAFGHPPPESRSDMVRWNWGPSSQLSIHWFCWKVILAPAVRTPSVMERVERYWLMHAVIVSAPERVQRSFTIPRCLLSGWSQFRTILSSCSQFRTSTTKCAQFAPFFSFTFWQQNIIHLDSEMWSITHLGNRIKSLICVRNWLHSDLDIRMKSVPHPGNRI